MTPGLILTFLGRPYAVMATVGVGVASLAFGGVQTVRLGFAQSAVARVSAEKDAFLARVEAATSKIRQAGADRIIRTQRAQITINIEEIRNANDRADRALARYNELRAHYRDSGGRQLAAVPAIPAPTGGFSEDPARPGFFSISASDAVTLMQNCDSWVSAFDELARWVDRQASIDPGVTVEIPSTDPVSE